MHFVFAKINLYLKLKKFVVVSEMVTKSRRITAFSSNDLPAGAADLCRPIEV